MNALLKCIAAAAAAKSLQLCPTLFDPIDGSPPGSPISGILQARTLEWVAISFSNAWKWKVKVKPLSRVWLLVTPWTAAYQALPMGFSRQEYWSGVPLPSPVSAIQQCKSVVFIHIFPPWWASLPSPAKRKALPRSLNWSSRKHMFLQEAPSWPHKQESSFKKERCLPCPKAWDQRRQWHPTPVLLPGKSHG